MQLITSPGTTRSTPALPARCYSLALPAWAGPAVGRAAADTRSTRRTEITRQELRRMRSHSTGIER